MLKSFLLSLSLVIVYSGLALAQDKEVVAVEKAVSELRAAMLSGNADQLRAISSKHLTYGHSSGVVEDQEAFIEALASGANKFTRIDLSDQTVNVIGKTALVRHNLSGNTHNKGADPASINLGVLLVWQKEGKDWKLVARQAFRR